MKRESDELIAFNLIGVNPFKFVNGGVEECDSITVVSNHQLKYPAATTANQSSDAADSITFLPLGR